MSTIEVFVADEQADETVDAGRWRDLARAVLQAEGVRGEAELSVLYVDEPAMSELNQRFMGRTGPTDVLSFPIDGDEIDPDRGSRPSDSRGPGPFDEPDSSDLPKLLGDVVVCPSVARRNAPDHAGTFDDEMALLLVHGILHLLGMDHHEDLEAQAMERRERELLERFHRSSTSASTSTSGPASGLAQPISGDPV